MKNKDFLEKFDSGEFFTEDELFETIVGEVEYCNNGFKLIQRNDCSEEGEYCWCYTIFKVDNRYFEIYHTRPLGSWNDGYTFENQPYEVEPKERVITEIIYVKKER